MDVVNFTTNGTGLQVLNSQPFVAFEVFAIILVLCIIFIALAHVMKHANDIYAGLAFLFSIAALYSGMSVAFYGNQVISSINTTINSTTVDNVTTLTTSNIYTYTQPVVSGSSMWLNATLIVVAIIALLNIIYVHVEVTGKRIEEERKNTSGAQRVAKERIYVYDK